MNKKYIASLLLLTSSASMLGAARSNHSLWERFLGLGCGSASDVLVSGPSAAPVISAPAPTPAFPLPSAALPAFVLPPAALSASALPAAGVAGAPSTPPRRSVVAQDSPPILSTMDGTPERIVKKTGIMREVSPATKQRIKRSMSAAPRRLHFGTPETLTDRALGSKHILEKFLLKYPTAEASMLLSNLARAIDTGSGLERAYEAVNKFNASNYDQMIIDDKPTPHVD